MASWLVLSEEERNVDPQLGYPRGYAKLCRHAHAWVHSNIFPYSEGPPRKFIPYALPPDDIAKLKDFENLFPVINDDSRDTLNVQRYAEMLWRQLDHLGNAGFDPAKFRVDTYGNVLYWHADPASPLAWEVAHWFPHSRGGKSVLNNLRIVQWQVSLRKRNRLEFLVPWWDLQLGVSVNHFLSAFASTNVEFRRRCFSYLFQSGEDEQISDELVVENHHWPHHFLEKKSRWGLAAAALVRQQRDVDDVLRSLNGPRPGSGYTNNFVSSSLARKRWSLEEEEALKRAVQKFGFGCWKEIKDCEPALMHRSTVQIRDKEADKENMRSDASDKQSTFTFNLQKEARLKKIRDEEKEEKAAEVAQQEEKLKAIKEQNEKEKEALETLECMLMQQRKQVEKQQQWNETQASYRLCLERMVHETMHQSVIYKEEARLNQAACNSLMAQLDSLTAACGAAEVDFLKRSKQREALLSLIQNNLSKAGEALNKANVLPHAGTQIEAPQQLNYHNNARAASTSRRRSSGKRHRLRVDADKCARLKIDDGSTAAELVMQKDEQDAKRSKPEYKTYDPQSIMAAEEAKAQCGGAALKVEAFEEERAPNATQMAMETASLENQAIQQEEGNQRNSAAAQVSKPDSIHDMHSLQKKSEEDQLDDLLEEVLVMQGKTDESFERDEVNEEEKLRLGKHTLDKWLQLLLVSPADLLEEEKVKSKTTEQDEQMQQATMKDCNGQKPVENEIVEIVEAEMESATGRTWAHEHKLAQAPTEMHNMEVLETQEVVQKSRADKCRKPLAGGLFRKLSVRHQPNELRSGKRNGQDDVESVASGDCETITTKMAAMKIESNKPKETEATVTKIIKRAISPFSRRKSLKTDNANSQNGLTQKESSQATVIQPLKPASLVGVVPYADTRKLDARQQASIKACAQASRRASLNECAETWKNEVRRLETRKNTRQYY
ncbi:hypothetical protein O6H91_04G045200 [Diphasiastrum complanatum]|uniref:Uncharacterized protein n=1 Tax=Diphasiastrum complanatum TaxID=34168 RepID=A0ACC2DW99_DIPCM|nr:hypothetical protein O6H91_04G045200 [Diphasiastrum complanatum]